MLKEPWAKTHHPHTLKPRRRCPAQAAADTQKFASAHTASPEDSKTHTVQLGRCLHHTRTLVCTASTPSRC